MKMTKAGKSRFIVVLAAFVFVLVGCGGTNGTSSTQTPNTIPTPTSTQASAVSTEQPVPTVSVDQVSSSDIPDTQVFVAYTSSSGKYQLKVPEGWAQTTNGADVSFVRVNGEPVASALSKSAVPASSIAISEKSAKT